MNFRIPVELKQRLENAAEKNNRSFKAELEFRLDRWDDVYEQVLRLQENWEYSRIKAENLQELSDALHIEIGDALSREEALEEALNEANRLQMHWRKEAAMLGERFAIPQSLTRRIERQTQNTGRTVAEEVTLALEAAFPPPPVQFATQSGLGLTAFHWRADAWHMVDWDSFSRFRAGDNTTQITTKRVPGINYLVVAVFDPELTNIIPHAYSITADGYKSAIEKRLTKEEDSEYHQFMIASTTSPEAQKRLRELQNKLSPVLMPPSEAIEPLRNTLAEHAPDEIVERLLTVRGFLAH